MAAHASQSGELYHRSEPSNQSELSNRLVFSLCHELGNFLAAVRFLADLVDSDKAPKELAVTSVEIDDLAARAGALLALVRPVLTPVQAPLDPVSPSQILAAVGQALSDHGGRGVELGIECESELPAVRVDPEAMHHLLLTLVLGAVEAAQHKGRVSVVGCTSGDQVVFSIEDDGKEDDQLLAWGERTLRGRTLACAVADFIVRKQDGRLEAERESGLTRVRLSFPKA